MNSYWHGACEEACCGRVRVGQEKQRSCSLHASETGFLATSEQ
jgi:hypothetical protein